MYCQYYQLSNLSLSKLKTKMAKFGLGRHFYLIEVPQGWGVTGARPARVAVGVVSRTVRSPMLRDRVVAITRPCLHPVPTGTGTIPGWPRSPLSVNFKVKETYKYMYLRVIKPFKQYTYFVFFFFNWYNLTWAWCADCTGPSFRPTPHTVYAIVGRGGVRAGPRTAARARPRVTRQRARAPLSPVRPVSVYYKRMIQWFKW